MKYSQWIGVAAAIVLVTACFMPWAYYPDIKKDFTGFFSENNIYGKPAKVFITLAAFASIFFLIPKIWAKRWNLLIGALVMAYAIKTFILYSGCYGGTCPERKTGIWIMLGSSLLILLMTVFPDTPIVEKKKATE
jgi:uncharacterized BrkB/YihY/UPF0761 family membrane protein